MADSTSGGLGAGGTVANHATAVGGGGGKTVRCCHVWVRSAGFFDEYSI